MNFKELTLTLIDENPYLLTDEIIGDYCAFSVNGEVMIRKYAETFDYNCDWIKGIFAKPEELGYFHRGTTISNGVESHIISNLGKNEINEIEAMGGRCKVEIMEPHFLTKDDVQPEHVKFEPIKLNDKIIVYLV